MNNLNYECRLKKSGISRGVHKKPQVFACDSGISTNQQGQGFHLVRKVREFRGSWKSQGRKRYKLKVKGHMHTEMCAVKLCTTVSCITEPIICI